jgi:hypothetical protein
MLLIDVKGNDTNPPLPSLAKGGSGGVFGGLSVSIAGQVNFSIIASATIDVVEAVGS